MCAFHDDFMVPSSDSPSPGPQQALLTGRWTGHRIDAALKLSLFIHSFNRCSKSTRLEVHKLTPEGLQGVLDVPLYGRIAALQLFRPAGEPRDLLLLLTERSKFCVLAFDEETGGSLLCQPQHPNATLPLVGAAKAAAASAAGASAWRVLCSDPCLSHGRPSSNAHSRLAHAHRLL